MNVINYNDFHITIDTDIEFDDKLITICPTHSFVICMYLIKYRY